MLLKENFMLLTESKEKLPGDTEDRKGLFSSMIDPIAFDVIPGATRKGQESWILLERKLVKENPDKILTEGRFLTPYVEV